LSSIPESHSSISRDVTSQQSAALHGAGPGRAGQEGSPQLTKLLCTAKRVAPSPSQATSPHQPLLPVHLVLLHARNAHLENTQQQQQQHSVDVALVIAVCTTTH